MKWSNLKSYTCPKDGETLKDIGHYHACTREGCIFSINKEKFDSIVSEKQNAYKEPDRSGWDW